MKYLLTVTFAALVSVLGLTEQVDAQTTQNAATQNTPMAQAGQQPAQLVAASAKKIGYRVTQWKTVHSNSEQEAQTDIATLKKLGCEVTSENHDNHIDVKYRCPEWKSVKVATDQLVNQWSTWCVAKGMETVVINPPANTKKATVKYRLPQAKTAHLHDATQAAQIINTLKLIGCEVSTNSHGDHMDATFSCPNWLTIELESEQSAHSWQKWLDDSGFETQHTHIK
ncbi:MAG: hypothetical protein AB8B55_24675 [Mariniblastus sp.]